MVSMPRLWLPTCACAVAIATAALAGQASSAGQASEVRRVDVLDPAEWLRHGIDYRPTGGPVPLLSWERQVAPDRGADAQSALPLPAGRDRIDFARLGDDVLVALAGGLRESLDIYVLTAAGGIRRLASDGGRRLQSSFGGGLGSWPIAVGDQVFVAAYEKAGRIEVRAFGPGQQVFGSRAWPMSVRGFDVAVQGHKVVVRPIGADLDALEFAHPQMPRVDVTPAQHDFGGVVLGEVAVVAARLTNPSPVATSVELKVDAPGFTVRPAVVQIGRRGLVDVTVSFRPEQAGEHRATLLVHGGGQLQSSMSLTGQGVARVAVAVRAASEPEATPPRAEPEVVKAAPDVPVPAPAAPVAAAPVLVPVYQPAAISPPGLALVGRELLVEASAGERVLLAAVAVHSRDGETVATRPLATWLLQLPAQAATIRVPVAAVLTGEVEAHFLVLRRAAGQVAMSPLVQVRGSQ